MTLRPDYLVGSVEYQHRLSEGWSAYAEGHAGVGSDTIFGASAGMTYRW